MTNNNWIIYKVTAPNNKVYIGMTSCSLSVRKKQQLHWQSGTKCSVNIQVAWQMHQTDNILLGDNNE